MRYDVSKDDLISRMGGSQQAAVGGDHGEDDGQRGHNERAGRQALGGGGRLASVLPRSSGHRPFPCAAWCTTARSGRRSSGRTGRGFTTGLQA
jgi:hypothetical protein